MPGQSDGIWRESDPIRAKEKDLRSSEQLTYENKFISTI